jgi:hypothetical protein
MHANDAIERLRAICMALPEASERLSHGEPSWFAGEKGKQFVMVSNHHHDDPRTGFWCPAPPGAQEVLVGAEPERFFRPPYVGHRGWLGVYLDVPQDWDHVADLVREAYVLVAPKRLATLVGPVRQTRSV